jgi:aspartate aminotransferase-like enzyme
MLMTPGPTAVPDRVRERMAEPMPNPDLDPEFASLYADLTEKLGEVYGTDDDVLVMGGEGILGLEAAVASLVDGGDDVLCISNGLYGDGFADFVERHGGDPERVEFPDTADLDPDRVAEAAAESDADVATLVHCETPTGVLNDVAPVLEVLADAGVLTVVDAVSSLGGAPVPTEHVDVCLGASQKCLSSPPGLTTVTVSDPAWERIEAVDEQSFYTNLAPWRDVDESGQFPYTHLGANVAALDEAVDLLLDEGLENAYERHEMAAARCRERAADAGVDLYASDPALSSPTVTALRVPGRATEVQERMDAEHDVVVATGLGDLTDDVIRVGHMGYNADVQKVDRTMDALEAVRRTTG